jgi:glycerol uptake facilitator-like aquaporin
MVIIGGDLTGTSLNPARSLGPSIACNYWEYQWVYYIGPPVGGVLAWMVYAITHNKSQS